MYNSVTEFLKEQINPEMYNMENESENDEYRKIVDPAERYFIYKSGNIPNNCVYPGALQFRDNNRKLREGLTDCDKCGLTQEIYRVLWKDAIADFENSGIYANQGETMTSLQGSLNLAIKLIETGEEHARYSKGRPSLAYYLELLTSSENFLERIDNIPGFKKFANTYHTIGNFIPVPCGFNIGRSNFGKSDYWDLSLITIKKWYDEGCKPGTKNSRDIIKELLNKPSDMVIRECEKWLWWFGNKKNGLEGWMSFIKNNYLEDFVNKDSLYQPIRFCPNDEFAVSEFFKTCSELIIKRGQRLISELEKEIN